jgi:hypothetical protein
MPPEPSTARTPPPASRRYRGGRDKQHAAASEPAERFVRDRLPASARSRHVLLRVVDRFSRSRAGPHGPCPVADRCRPVDLVADHDERGEREPPAALDDLRDAVDPRPRATLSSRVSCTRRLPLEAQSSFACAFRRVHLDATMDR